MHQHEQFFASDPSLKSYTALARLSGVETRALGRGAPDLARATRLRDAIGVFAYQDPSAASRSAPHAAGHLAQPLPGEHVAARSVQRAPGEAQSDSVSSNSVEFARVGRSSDGAPIAAVEALMFEVGEPVAAGDLLVLDPLQPGALRRASSADDPGVAGIAASASSASDGVERVAVVTALYAVVNADARYGAIRPGDLLVTSATPGHAMSAVAPLPGTVIGKALQPLDAGTGAVRVLLGVR
jgi:hypothetical protein